MASHHDSLFHRTFADPANAAAMFRLALPPTLVAAIDWSTLTEITSKVTDDDLRKHFPDHLFAVRLRDHDLELRLLPEHKSEEDRALLGHFDIGGLGAVRAKDPELAATIAANGVSLVASVLDLAVRDEEWLRSAEFPDLAKLVVLCLRFVRFQDAAEGAATLDRWRDLIAAVHHSPRGQSGLLGVASYLLEITDLTLEQLRDVVQRAIGPGDDMTKFTSTADRLRQEGQARGEALGRTEQGVTTVLRLLARRFGTLPQSIADRVHAATLAELDLWTDRILDAKNIDEVFAAE